MMTLCLIKEFIEQARSSKQVYHLRSPKQILQFLDEIGAFIMTQSFNHQQAELIVVHSDPQMLTDQPLPNFVGLSTTAKA